MTHNVIVNFTKGDRMHNESQASLHWLDLSKFLLALICFDDEVNGDFV